MDDEEIRKYFYSGYAIKFLQLAVFAFSLVVGLIYLFFFVPAFTLDDYFQVLSMTVMILVAFLLSSFVSTPLEYRLDRKYGRITLGFRSYLAYRMRSRLVFLIPFVLLLLLYAGFWFLSPVQTDFTSLFTLLTSLIMVLIVGLVMPKIYGSALKKERIEDQSLVDSIMGVADKMGIKGKFTGAYHVPVRGLRVVNAAQLGFARRQARVYLIGDIEQVLNRNEIDAVVAHEFAHLKLRHILKLMLILLALMAGFFSFFTMIATALLDLLLASSLVLTDEMLFTIFVFVEYLLPFLVLYLVLLKMRRVFESQADLLAATVTSPMDLATSLEKLAQYNLIPMKFPKIIGILKGHPSMKERIDRLKRMDQLHMVG